MNRKSPHMEISFTTKDLIDWKGSTLIVASLEGEAEEQVKALLSLKAENLSESLDELGFTGKVGEVATLQLLDMNFNKLILVGLGKEDLLVLDNFRTAASLGSQKTIGSKGKLGVYFPWEKINKQLAIPLIAEAFRLSAYRDNRFKSEPEELNIPQKVDFIGIESEKDYTKDISSICSGVELARELVAAPPNKVDPLFLAETALSIAKEYGLESKILEEDECQSRGMGAYLAVSQGSDLNPKFIHLTYKSTTKINHRLAIVGKGLTFDSGGYNLKVGGAQIDMMKFDMGGSAAVLGAAKAIGQLKPEGLEIHFIVAACENMINGSAVHPGDIVTASNGKTIEINNTDAEGRLTLADALVYTCALKPDKIIDLATLTGACVVALGDEIAGLWTSDDALAEEILLAAEATGEGLWRMPLRESYKEGLKSIYADLKNTGPRAGGSITAALFLQEFVDKSIAWAHIDIAGTVWTEKVRGVNPIGATGYGVRTLVNWAINQK